MTAKPAAKGTTARQGKRPSEAGFAPVLARLKAILEAHRGRLVVAKDGPGGCLLNSPKPYQGRELFFAGVQLRKSYVSYYLFPVYMFPELLKGLSPALKRRMQGKSCFNFGDVDEALFSELAALTKRGLEAFRERGLL